MGFTVYWKNINVCADTFISFLLCIRSLTDIDLDITSYCLKIHSSGTGESFKVYHNGEYFNSCTTNDEPYTKTVLMALVLMIELGMAFEVTADRPEEFLEVIDIVDKTIPLMTYADLKEYFRLQIPEIC